VFNRCCTVAGLIPGAGRWPGRASPPALPRKLLLPPHLSESSSRRPVSILKCRTGFGAAPSGRHHGSVPEAGLRAEESEPRDRRPSERSAELEHLFIGVHQISQAPAKPAKISGRSRLEPAVYIKLQCGKARATTLLTKRGYWYLSSRGNTQFEARIG
jgi:hypothetical protein